MTQTRQQEKTGTPWFRVELNFEWYEGVSFLLLLLLLFIYLFFCFFYLGFFCLERNGKKGRLDENDFHQSYGNYFKSFILKVTLYQLYLKFFLKIYEAHWQQHFKETFQFKILRQWLNIRANSSLIYIMKQKWKTISCTKLWVCFIKSISLIIVFFILAQTNQVFKFNFMLIE